MLLSLPFLCSPKVAADGLANSGRDLSLEASIIDIQDLMTPPTDSDPLRGLRRAVAAHAAAPAGIHDGIDALAASLAQLLEGTGVRVAVREPHVAAAAGAARAGRAAEAFVLRGRFIVIKGAEDEGEPPSCSCNAAATMLCSRHAVTMQPSAWMPLLAHTGVADS